MLTRQQQKLLTFIRDFQQKNGISPSFDEMRCALNQKSKSSVHMLLTGLIERGFIRKLNNRARAIEIIKFTNGALPVLSVQENISLSFEKDLNTAPKETSIVDLPFYGRQNTIFPVKVFLSSPEKILSLSKESFCYISGQDYCAIQVSGEALKEMAILNDDILLFRMSAEALPGQIVLAVVDDENIHMKRWEIRDGKIILSLGNKYMMPQVYDPERVKIKGCMVGLVRKSL